MAACITAVAAARPVYAEPLPDMLHGLLETHPRIKAAAQQVHGAESSVTEAWAGWYPSVDLSAGGGWEKTDRTGLDPAGSDTDLGTISGGVTVTQNIFQGFRTETGVTTANTTLEAAKTSKTLIEQQVMFEGITAYLSVLKQVKLTELSLENQKTLKEQLNLEDERVKRGSGIAVDVLQAKSRLQISKERYSAFLGGLRDASSRFSQVFASESDISSMTVPHVPLDNLPQTLEQAIEIAKQHNPSLISSKQTAEIAGHGRELAKSSYFPSIDIVADSTYDDDAAGVRGEEFGQSLKLRASWNIFSGFADKARVQRAAYDYRAAMDNSAFTANKVVEEVRLAWSALETSKERSDLLDNAVNIAGEVYDARKRLRDAGSETALNVLDAENELFRARIDATAARYDYYIAVYRLLLSMGTLGLDKV